MILHLRLHVRLYLTSNIIYVDFEQLLNVDKSIFYNHGIICINISTNHIHVLVLCIILGLHFMSHILHLKDSFWSIHRLLAQSHWDNFLVQKEMKEWSQFITTWFLSYRIERLSFHIGYQKLQGFIQFLKPSPCTLNRKVICLCGLGQMACGPKMSFTLRNSNGLPSRSVLFFVFKIISP